MELVFSCVIVFVFESWQIQLTSMAGLPSTKLLTNLALSSRASEVLPIGHFFPDLTALCPYCHYFGPTVYSGLYFGKVVLLNKILLDNSVVSLQASRLRDQSSCACIVIIYLLSGDWIVRNK